MIPTFVVSNRHSKTCGMLGFYNTFFSNLFVTHHTCHKVIGNLIKSRLPLIRFRFYRFNRTTIGTPDRIDSLIRSLLYITTIKYFHKAPVHLTHFSIEIVSNTLPRAKLRAGAAQPAGFRMSPYANFLSFSVLTMKAHTLE